MPPDSESDLISKAVEEERNRLRALPFVPYDLDINKIGVLLSDQIQYYCQNFNLIDEWDPSCLRPAGYDLRVGSNVSIRGENKVLRDFESISIGPYQVAVIETYERLNMPEFLIGRWNIRVALAYDGLLWVGGAQVDPGFRGHLACPIYNLSDKDVSLTFKQPLAMLDFVTTTKVNNFSQRFDWEKRKKIVFTQYQPERLVSGITTKIEGRLDKFEEKTTQSIATERKQNQSALQRTQNRIDTFVTAILTVISVLFAGLGVVATRSSEPSLTATAVSLACIAAVALYFALRPYYVMSKIRTDIGDDNDGTQVMKEVARAMRIGVLELILAFGVVVSSLAMAAWSIVGIRSAASASASSLQKAQADRKMLEKQVNELRQQFEARAAEIETNVRALQVGKKDKQ